MKKLLLLSGLLFLGSCQTTPSEQALASSYEAYSGVQLCGFTYLKYWGVLASKQRIYKYYKAIVNEIDSRGLDCRSFPEYEQAEEVMRDRIEKFEKDGTW
jgi:hypothetical protein